MSQIITIQLGKETITGYITQSCKSDDFVSYTISEINSGQKLSIRIDSEENYKDLKERNIL